MEPLIAQVSEKSIQTFLESLKFPQYMERQDLVEVPEAGSFSWIHEHPNDDCTTLSMWLQNPTRVYWIMEKPGSGKSTIMKRIVEDEEAEIALTQASDKRLICASFFIWKPAKEPLQSILMGVLRSLIYQLLEQDQLLVISFLNEFTKRQRIPQWSSTKLKTLLLDVLVAAARYRYRVCFFIDGFDELPPESWIESHELSKLLIDVHKAHGTWLCISSRTEVPVARWFPDCCRLNLANWNWQDIRDFAADQLEPYGIAGQSLGTDCR